MKETRDLWDAWSEDFQAAWNAETADGELPPAPIHYGPGYPEDRRLALLPEVEGAAVVELGCGGGQASVGFAREGAARVVGVDFSPAQLAHARDLRDAYGVDAAFLAGDVTALPVAGDAFDIAHSSWVYQQVRDLEGAFAEVRRILRADGVFVFAIPHPFYRLFDPETHEIERSYFESDPERKSIGDIDAEMTVFHRNIGEIHAALVDTGFHVDRLLEPGSSDPGEYRESMSHKPDLMAKIPPTLVVRAVPA
jgi:SAM-dependent methyltransferase